MPMNVLAIFCLVTAAIGGVAYVFLYPILSGEKRGGKPPAGHHARRRCCAQDRRRGSRRAAKIRREQIEDRRFQEPLMRSARRPVARR